MPASLADLPDGVGQGLEPRRPLYLPPHANRTKNMFHCSYHTSQPSFKKIQESIPPPASLLESLTFAIAFIDQGIHASRTIDEKYEILEKRYQAATDIISNDLTELEKIRGETISRRSRIIELEDELVVQKRLSERLRLNLIKAGDGTIAVDGPETPKSIEVQEKLDKATARAKEFEGKFDEAQKEIADLKSQLAAVEKNNANLKEETTGLQTSIAAQETELLALRRELAQVSACFEEAKHHLDVDGHIIAGLQDERGILKKENRERALEVESIKTEYEATRRALNDELDKSHENAEALQEEKNLLEAKYQDSEEAKKASEAQLEEKTTLFEATHHDCEANLTAAKEARKSLNEEKNLFEAKHQDCEARLAAAEEARKSLEAQLEEAKKPVLPNKVTLRNPIAIAGSLTGALTKIDDVFFQLDLPFAVTLYGHASTKIFVTDNGMLCLDKGTDAVNHRIGQVLPSRDGIPPYSLFPFWTDLMICEGKPHGIYYEIVGETGARTLTVEWYVTRYGQEDQYFHFNLLLEEARPNVVTFKYYDAVDKGAQCTIGVQGPTEFKLFSYNEQKVAPGLQVVFDTGTANAMAVSTFSVE
ncbi:hypothetical protein G7Y89_g3875 [Cudoniella acicularis]|uniref:Uncharacterized protein n=1 Tax=Cudoniella acicularis TaxID=354080 RepID=A0A8H4RSF9_9HELO|nr:hypothetical protein G7Y89_g3875 [Cudoniella acicularis]